MDSLEEEDDRGGDKQNPSRARLEVTFLGQPVERETLSLESATEAEPCAAMSVRLLVSNRGASGLLTWRYMSS